MTSWGESLRRVTGSIRAVALTALAVLMLAAPQAAAGETPVRLALVIANSNYTDLPALPNARRDGDTISQALARAKFIDGSSGGAIQPRQDLSGAATEMELAALERSVRKAGPNTLVLIYFSGHGVGLGTYGDAALVPVDVSLASARGLITRAQITDRLLAAGARTVVIVLDMCRNALDGPALAATSVGPTSGRTDPVEFSPRSKGVTRYAPAQRRPDQGFLVAYSTSPDQLAFDTGLFSRVLAEEIVRPSQNLAEAFKRVSDRVALSSGARSWQKPTFDYGLQGEPPCFISCNPNSDPARFYDCANCPWMRVVPAGEALLGSAQDEPGRTRDELPARRVRIARPIAMSVFELTLGEWMACQLDGACRPRPNWSKDNPNPLIPATHLSYSDARDYLRWLSDKAGRIYRLPTEHEWEYAARAGVTGPFGFGDDISPGLANYDHTARYRNSAVGPFRGYPEAVTNYPPNAFGIAQSEGNVWEWTSSCFEGSPDQCRTRVLRGGSFQSVPAELRLASRFRLPEDKVRIDVGLRVVRDLDPTETVSLR